MVRSLYNLSDLKESRFGQPHPRHGLKLLWWFAQECVQIDSNQCMTALCNPENGDFGFRHFQNWDKLLPDISLPYYEVGNLKYTDSLPEYLTEDYTRYLDDSNTDRIIVSFKYGSNQARFESIYVTQHSDPSHFDQNHTYHVSTDLMKDIQKLSMEKFLKKTKMEIFNFYRQCSLSAFPSSVQSEEGEPYWIQKKSHHPITDFCAQCCKMLMCILFICALGLFLSMMKLSF